MANLLIVIDAQEDFIRGSLGTPEAQKIIPRLQAIVKEYMINGDTVIYTLDTHTRKDYKNSQEGRKLPVEHCIYGEFGHKIIEELEEVSSRYQNNDSYEILKSTFGSYELVELIAYKFGSIDPLTIELCGVCTDICVVSNAIMLKNAFPEAKIVVDRNGCAGTTPENHEAALKVMKCCQIDVIGEKL